MPVPVLKMAPQGYGGYDWRMPRAGDGAQYFLSLGPVYNGDVASVLTLRETEKMFKAMQKKIDSLTREVSRLKVAQSKATASRKKR